jgi:hypothetical protein
VIANSLSSWSRVWGDKKHSRKSGAGAFSSLGPFASRPYSPEYVEGVFSELRPNGVPGNSALSWCSDVLCALAHIHSPHTSVC